MITKTANKSMHRTRLTAALVIFVVEQTFLTQIIKIFIHNARFFVDTVLVKRKLAYNLDHTFCRISGRRR
jgi:hypothetical protein